MISYRMTDTEIEFRKVDMKFEILRDQFRRICQKLCARRAPNAEWVELLQILNASIARAEEELREL